MNWGFRIARKRYEFIWKNIIKTDYEYFLVDAYSDDNGKVGKVSIQPFSLYSSNLEQLALNYLRLKDAFYKPVLDYDNIPEPGYDPGKDCLNSIVNKQLFIDKIMSEDETNDELLEAYEKEDEQLRISSEKMFNHLIKEFIHEPIVPKEFTLASFYQKKD